MKVGPNHSLLDTGSANKYIPKYYRTEVKDKADNKIEAMASDVCSFILTSPFGFHQRLSYGSRLKVNNGLREMHTY